MDEKNPINTMQNEPKMVSLWNSFYKSSWGEFIRYGVIAVLIAVPFRIFIAQPFVVSGESMYPTFKDHDYLIVDRLTYRYEEPERGEVIVFRYPKDPSRFFIKRIIGLPGETIRLENGFIFVSKDGKPEEKIEETYLKDNEKTAKGTYKIGEGEYFVMGDNRPVSSDSRVWGNLPEKDITGRALIRLFPLRTIGILPGKI